MLFNSTSRALPLSTSDGALQAPDDVHGARPSLGPFSTASIKRASTIVPIASMQMYSKTNVGNETR